MSQVCGSETICDHSEMSEAFGALTQPVDNATALTSSPWRLTVLAEQKRDDKWYSLNRWWRYTDQPMPFALNEAEDTLFYGGDDLAVTVTAPAVCAKLFSRQTLTSGYQPPFDFFRQMQFWQPQALNVGAASESDVHVSVRCVTSDDRCRFGRERGLPLDASEETLEYYMKQFQSATSYYASTQPSHCTLQQLKEAQYEKQWRPEFREFAKTIKRIRHAAEQNLSATLSGEQTQLDPERLQRSREAVGLDRSSVRIVYWLYWPMSEKNQDAQGWSSSLDKETQRALQLIAESECSGSDEQKSEDESGERSDDDEPESEDESGTSSDDDEPESEDDEETVSGSDASGTSSDDESDVTTNTQEMIYLTSDERDAILECDAEVFLSEKETEDQLNELLNLLAEIESEESLEQFSEPTASREHLWCSGSEPTASREHLWCSGSEPISTSVAERQTPTRAQSCSDFNRYFVKERLEFGRDESSDDNMPCLISDSDSHEYEELKISSTSTDGSLTRSSSIASETHGEDTSEDSAEYTYSYEVIESVELQRDTNVATGSQSSSSSSSSSYSSEESMTQSYYDSDRDSSDDSESESASYEYYSDSEESKDSSCNNDEDEGKENVDESKDSSCNNDDDEGKENVDESSESYSYEYYSYDDEEEEDEEEEAIDAQKEEPLLLQDDSVSSTPLPPPSPSLSSSKSLSISDSDSDVTNDESYEETSSQSSISNDSAAESIHIAEEDRRQTSSTEAQCESVSYRDEQTYAAATTAELHRAIHCEQRIVQSLTAPHYDHIVIDIYKDFVPPTFSQKFVQPLDYMQTICGYIDNESSGDNEEEGEEEEQTEEDETNTSAHVEMIMDAIKEDSENWAQFTAVAHGRTVMVVGPCKEQRDNFYRWFTVDNQHGPVVCDVDGTPMRMETCLRLVRDIEHASTLGSNRPLLRVSNTLSCTSTLVNFVRTETAATVMIDVAKGLHHYMPHIQGPIAFIVLTTSATYKDFQFAIETMISAFPFTAEEISNIDKLWDPRSTDSVLTNIEPCDFVLVPIDSSVEYGFREPMLFRNAFN